MPRTWLINGRFLAQPASGVQRYGLEVVRALDRLLAQRHPLSRDLDIALVAPSGTSPPAGVRRIAFRTVGPAAWHGLGHLWEQARLPRFARGAGLLSLCNTGPVAVARHIACLHDASTRILPESHPPARRALYRVLHPALSRTAARIATVSIYSARCLVEHGICAQPRLLVAPGGHEHALRWIASHSPATRAVAGPNTVVMIGSAARHKNVGLILAMADRLEEAGLDVAITGLHDARVPKEQQRAGGRRGVTWLGRISDSELAALLRDSLCLALPSLEESLCLPALEAMALGCPVVASDRASLPELLGDAALYPSLSDDEAWLRAFVRLRNDAALRRRLSARGHRQAQRYRWERTAEIYLEEMARLDGLPLPSARLAPAQPGAALSLAGTGDFPPACVAAGAAATLPETVRE